MDTASGSRAGAKRSAEAAGLLPAAAARDGVSAAKPPATAPAPAPPAPAASSSAAADAGGGDAAAAAERAALEAAVSAALAAIDDERAALAAGEHASFAAKAAIFESARADALARATIQRRLQASARACARTRGSGGREWVGGDAAGDLDSLFLVALAQEQSLAAQFDYQKYAAEKICEDSKKRLRALMAQELDDRARRARARLLVGPDAAKRACAAAAARGAARPAGLRAFTPFPRARPPPAQTSATAPALRASCAARPRATTPALPRPRPPATTALRWAARRRRRRALPRCWTGTTRPCTRAPTWAWRRRWCPRRRAPLSCSASRACRRRWRWRCRRATFSKT
jgi:hypothetical protein